MSATRSEASRSPDVHLNLRVRGMKPSVTLAINERSDALRREGRQVYKLGLGQSPFPVPAPVIEELKANAFQKDYLPVRGLRALREAVADYHRRTQGIAGSADQVLVGPGSKELLFLVQLVYYGNVLIPTPAWVSYGPQASVIGRRVVWLPTEASQRWLLGPEQLEAACRDDPDQPRLLILNYPSNPTGTTYDEDDLRQLAAVAERYRVVVISDEIYGELDHHGAHLSIARFYPQGTIISSGLSKWCGAGGWRLGTFMFPSGLMWLMDAMSAVASETYTSTSAPIQYAAVRAFRGGSEIEHYLREARRVLHALCSWCLARLRSAGVDVVTPQGGFYLFPDFSPLRARLAERGVKTSVDLAQTVLEETGVATLPGAAFGRVPEELTLRLACVDFDGARVLGAAEAQPDDPLDDGFFRTYAPNVTRGIDALLSWIDAGAASSASTNQP